MDLYVAVLHKTEIANEKKTQTNKQNPTSKLNSIGGFSWIPGLIYLYLTKNKQTNKKHAIVIQKSSWIQMDKSAAHCEEVQKQKNYISVALHSMQ